MPKLHWIGREQVVQHHRDVPVRAIDLQYNYTAPSETPANSSGNRIIHGDNLDALKSLLPEFEGRVNCIYIDPPYNTGNEGWVYNDAMNDPKMKRWLGQVVGKEGEDLTRHDKWLCMMYPRLKLLHRLLADDGVIFVSIDDNEQAHLKLVMDEIFGYKNCIGPIIQNKMNAKNDSLNVQKNHEFILVYGKPENIEKTTLLSNKGYSEKKVFYENGEYYFYNDPITTRGDGGTLNARPNLGYTIYFNKETNDKIAVCDYDISLAKETNDEDEVYSTDVTLIEKGYVAIRPPKVRKKLGAWTWDLDKFNQDKNNIVITGKLGVYSVRKRTFVDRGEVFTKDGSDFYRYFNPTNSRSILEFSTNNGIKILNDVMDESNLFDNPKNLELLEYILGLTQNKNAIILDSFAGSGTTAHAVLKLNAQDGGNRRFILVETMDYAETITAERVRRVMAGYGEGKKAVAGLGGVFDFYKVGARLFDDFGHLNPAAAEPKIRAYIAWQEGLPLDHLPAPDAAQSPYWLGTAHDSARYFCYEANAVVILDFELLATLKITSQRSVIYADVCTLGPQFMAQRKITFKKIPRDIAKL